jgi:hypothetical protein
MRTPQKNALYAIIVITILFLTRTTPAQGPASEAGAAVQRALTAYGRQWATDEILDSISEGKLTFFSADGAKATFDVTVFRKGTTLVQRVIKQPAGDLRQGTDGNNSWEAIPGFYTPSAQGRAMQFIESQTSRSVHRLLNHQKEGLTLRDLGAQDKARLIEAEDRQGRKTTYSLDSDTNLFTRLEFVTGQVKDPFSGATLPDKDSYVFSDNRLLQGILTPFKIERYKGRDKIEEMQFTTVRYNAGLKNTDFRR